jgi:23S rRNA pseudouridine1911/1915/1917 synthase
MSTRSYVVGRAEAGRTLADWLHARLRLPRSAVAGLLRTGRVHVGGRPCPDPARRLRRGDRVHVGPPPRPGPLPRKSPPGAPGRAPRPSAAAPALPAGVPPPVVRHADEHVVVADKPAGLTTMRHPGDVEGFGARARRFLPPTLQDILPGLLAGGRPGRSPPLRAVHRLDKETSGLVVFARTAAAQAGLGKQFRAHTTERLYLALVRGRARPGRIESRLVRDRGDGRRGSTSEPGAGQRAVTHVHVLEELGDFTLVECRLETGRTHQVRIHLGEAGTPLCGERVYDRPPHGRPVPDGSGAPRVALHAAVLGFDHPAAGERVRWESPLPADLAGLLRRLRRRRDRPGGGPAPG